MLIQAACLFLISEVASLDYEDLVIDVENTLDECIGILKDVGRYVDEVNLLQDVSRRAEDETGDVATGVRLGACFSILKAVDGYRKNHMRLSRYQNFLQWGEQAYLNELLEPLSMKMGDGFYVASVDGDSITDFMAAGGNQSPHLIIIESTNGAVFGGFTDKEWSLDVTWQSSSKAFLFRLRPSFKQFKIIGQQAATHFGGNVLRFGSDLYLKDHALNNSNSLAQGSHYDITGYELNDGERYFQAREWVAVKVENL